MVMINTQWLKIYFDTVDGRKMITIITGFNKVII
jgi:translation initiation factor 1 (eIF-1/SUI1)